MIIIHNKVNILDLFFPKKCLECGTAGVYICGTCLEKITPGKYDKNNYSIFKYEGVIRKAIIFLKYKFATDTVNELVNACVSRLSFRNFARNSVVLIPIPLHRKRENWRGFNQSEIIGGKLAEKMSWEFVPNLLRRVKNTKPQVGLKKEVRYLNLIDVFEINPSQLFSLDNKTLVIFDDVYTTGSTIKEARKILMKTGAKNIKGLTIAR